MTLARADMAGMTSTGNPVAHGACEACKLTSLKLRAAREGAWTIRWSRFFTADVDRRRTILMVSAATRSEMPWWRMRCMEFCAEILTEAWWCVDGQMWMFLAEMCKAIENLHSDMSYVLIGGHRWQIRWWQWFWRWRRSFWRWRFNPEDLWQWWSHWERALKRFTNNRSWDSGKYRQNKIARYKKIRAVALIPC